MASALLLMSASPVAQAVCLAPQGRPPVTRSLYTASSDGQMKAVAFSRERRVDLADFPDADAAPGSVATVFESKAFGMCGCWLLIVSLGQRPQEVFLR